MEPWHCKKTPPLHPFAQTTAGRDEEAKAHKVDDISFKFHINQYTRIETIGSGKGRRGPDLWHHHPGRIQLTLFDHDDFSLDDKVREGEKERRESERGKESERERKRKRE